MNKPVCSACGSDDVLLDAYVRWDVGGQTYEIANVFDKGHYCNNCNEECSIKWLEEPDDD